MLRGRMSRALAVAAVALFALVGAEAASAGANTVQDGNDRPGRLDIRSVSQGHSGGKVTHTIRTFGRWPKSLLDERHSNSFLVLINTDSDARVERFVVIITVRGRVTAGVLTAGGNFLGRTDVSRPGRRSLRVSISRNRLGNPAGYGWQAFSSFQGSGGCRNGCVDRAPNRVRLLLHDLRAPAVSFPQPPPPAGQTYDLQFTVRDRGGSSLDLWRLEHREAGIWEEVDHGRDTGPQSVPFTAAAPGDVDVFRVVAVDEHGNRTVSLERQVTAPSAS
ncbi:MAG: hypothetical protein ACRDMY_10730 [Gaiellaceae bacterium]